MWPETDPERWLDFLVRVSSISALVGLVSGLSPRKKFGQIQRDLAEIWPDPSRSGRNLAGYVEIWPRFRRITARSRQIWLENRNTSLER